MTDSNKYSSDKNKSEPFSNGNGIWKKIHDPKKNNVDVDEEHVGKCLINIDDLEL